jgi:hypothetical protein
LLYKNEILKYDKYIFNYKFIDNECTINLKYDTYKCEYSHFCKNEANKICDECQLLFCDNCTTEIHNIKENFNNHIVENIDYNIIYEKCKQHPNCFINSYCTKCELKVCKICSLESHNTCKVIILKELFKSNEIWIKNLKNSLNENIKEIELENKGLKEKFDKNIEKINEIVNFSNNLNELDVTWYVKNQKIDEKYKFKKRRIDVLDY